MIGNDDQIEGQMNMFDYLSEVKKDKLQELEERYSIPRYPKKYLREEGWIDDWHYAELEDPEWDDVYYGIELFGNHDDYSYTYIAWVNGKGWFFWDSWKEIWKQNTHRKVLAWVQIPSLYRKVDKGLHKRLGLEGII